MVLIFSTLLNLGFNSSCETEGRAMTTAEAGLPQVPAAVGALPAPPVRCPGCLSSSPFCSPLAFAKDRVASSAATCSELSAAWA